MTRYKYLEELRLLQYNNETAASSGLFHPLDTMSYYVSLAVQANANYNNNNKKMKSASV